MIVGSKLRDWTPLQLGGPPSDKFGQE